MAATVWSNFCCCGAGTCLAAMHAEAQPHTCTHLLGHLGLLQALPVLRNERDAAEDGLGAEGHGKREGGVHTGDGNEPVWCASRWPVAPVNGSATPTPAEGLSVLQCFPRGQWKACVTRAVPAAPCLPELRHPFTRAQADAPSAQCTCFGEQTTSFGVPTTRTRAPCHSSAAVPYPHTLPGYLSTP